MSPKRNKVSVMGQGARYNGALAVSVPSCCGRGGRANPTRNRRVPASAHPHHIPSWPALDAAFGTMLTRARHTICNTQASISVSISVSQEGPSISVTSQEGPCCCSHGYGRDDRVNTVYGLCCVAGAGAMPSCYAVMRHD